MKALLLAPQPYYSDRGTPMNIRAMVSVLTEAGIAVDLLTYPVGRDTPMKGLSINRVPRPPGMKKVAIGPSAAKILLDTEMLPAAYHMAGNGNYSILHTIEEAVYIGILLKKRFDLPLIYDMDSSLKDQLANYGFARNVIVKNFFSYMERLAVRASDGIITVCRSLTDIVRGIDSSKPVYQIEDIPLMVDKHEEPADAQDLISLMEGRKVLLYTGNFEPYQGLHLLIEAVPPLIKRHPEALLVMVGGSGKHLESVKKDVKKHGIEKSVIMIEPRPPAQMDWFMSRSFALLSPRIKGTNTPLKIYTYLSSGRPVVATRMPTHTQVLDDGWSMLVEPEAGAFAQGLISLLDDPVKADNLGKEGKRLVEERYSREKFKEKLLLAYREIGRNRSREKY